MTVEMGAKAGARKGRERDKDSDPTASSSDEIINKLCVENQSFCDQGGDGVRKGCESMRSTQSPFPMILISFI